MIIKIFKEKPLSLGLYSTLPDELKNVKGLVYEPTQEEINLVKSHQPIKFENGKVVLDTLALEQNKVRTQKTKEKLNHTNELTELEKWFDWYDTQVIQHDRDIRLFKKSSIDIKALDTQAVEKAKRIKELRTLIAVDEK